MKSEKGVTLISLLTYVAILLTVMVIIGRITGVFQKRLDNIDAENNASNDYTLLNYTILTEVKKYKSTDIKTLVYPGFATDLQQIMATFLTQCRGRSIIEETIYENRFQNLKELDKMGANTKVTKDNHKATIKGKTKLIGTDVTATDLRGGASLLVAGLIAEGTTTIDNIAYILRGYDKIIEKLSSVGAKIEII